MLGRRIGQHENKWCKLYTIQDGMAKEALNKKTALFANEMDLRLRKELVRC
jgi:hypothetical protein